MTQSTTTAWNGAQLLAGLQAASIWLEQHVGEVNALNVFPVPDGDTGTNMHLTMTAALKDVAPSAIREHACQADRTPGVAGNRGNSGVILSQIIRGFSDGLAGKDEVTPLRSARHCNRRPIAPIKPS